MSCTRLENMRNLLSALKHSQAKEKRRSVRKAVQERVLEMAGKGPSCPSSSIRHRNMIARGLRSVSHRLSKENHDGGDRSRGLQLQQLLQHPKHPRSCAASGRSTPASPPRQQLQRGHGQAPQHRHSLPVTAWAAVCRSTPLRDSACVVAEIRHSICFRFAWVA